MSDLHLAGREVGDRLHHRAALAGARIFNFFRAGYTAGSFVAALAPDGELLLVKPTYREGWGLSGGGMKRGEQSAEALSREVLEETGMAIEIDRPRHVYVQAGRRHIDHLFVLPLSSKEAPRPRKTREIAAAAWYPLTGLPPLQREACEALDRLAMAGDLDPAGGSKTNERGHHA